MPKAKTTNVESRTRRNPYRTARPIRGQNTLPEVENRNAFMDTVAVGQNNKGLPSLPLELHLEILSYLYCQQIPCISIRDNRAAERFKVIYALLRTCKALYRVYNPQFWKIVEARGWRCNKVYHCDQAQDLFAYVRALTGQGPHFAALVQVFNVELITHSSRTVYRALARCLPHLPNLHTFQVMSFPPGGTDQKLDISCLQDFEEAFARIAPLSGVHTLTLPPALIARLDMKRIFPSLHHMCLHQLGMPTRHKIPRELKLIPRDLEALTLPRHSARFVESDIKYVAALFRDLRVTPRLSFDRDRKTQGELKKAFQSVFDGWRRVHTIEIVNNGAVGDLSCLWEDEKFIEMMTKGIQRNLAMEENKDVRAGGIKIWHWDQAEPQRVISVRRREDE
ncbi:hypothetical protein CPB85DRAFT_1438063 [Mucidula mucida]|nr:hypothetical protein CPB85DRAFT_1438063 [Mucidula mucida]